MLMPRQNMNELTSTNNAAFCSSVKVPSPPSTSFPFPLRLFLLMLPLLLSPTCVGTVYPGVQLDGRRASTCSSVVVLRDLRFSDCRGLDGASAGGSEATDFRGGILGRSRAAGRSREVGLHEVS